MIIKAKKEDFERIRYFYFDIIDDMKNTKYQPGWEKDVYPSKKYLMDSILNGELYIKIENDEVIAAMIVNNKYEPGYDEINWDIQASDEELLIIHTLGISFKHQGKGIAKDLLGFVKEKGRMENKKAIRLDVLASNTPAHRLYKSKGFKSFETIKLFYEDTGLADFLVYEYII